MPLIHTKLWLEPPGGCHAPHQQQPAPFISLMGFIFLTLTIYQAEAVWREEERGIKFPKRLLRLDGENRWFMVPLPFPITLWVPCLFPSLPAVLRLLSPLSANALMYSIKPPSFPARSLWLLPAPYYSPRSSLPPSRLILCSLPTFSRPKCAPFVSPSCCRTLGTTAPCTSPRWRPSTWGTTAAMPMDTKTSIRHMCCRWMVSSASFFLLTVS